MSTQNISQAKESTNSLTTIYNIEWKKEDKEEEQTYSKKKLKLKLQSRKREEEKEEQDEARAFGLEANRLAHEIEAADNQQVGACCFFNFNANFSQPTTTQLWSTSQQQQRAWI